MLKTAGGRGKGSIQSECKAGGWEPVRAKTTKKCTRIHAWGARLYSRLRRRPIAMFSLFFSSCHWFAVFLQVGNRTETLSYEVFFYVPVPQDSQRHPRLLGVIVNTIVGKKWKNKLPRSTRVEWFLTWLTCVWISWSRLLSKLSENIRFEGIHSQSPMKYSSQSC